MIVIGETIVIKWWIEQLAARFLIRSSNKQAKNEKEFTRPHRRFSSVSAGWLRG